jgi:hypothetical protein
MKRWPVAVRDAILTGSFASVLSTMALAAGGQRENRSPVAPTNAISHWIWGDRAALHDEPSVRHTLVGYVIHHLASVFWAAFYERWFGERVRRADLPGALRGGASVAALACFVDYRLTPRRLQPGYEMRLSRRSLVAVYAAFGVGLVLGSVVRDRR